MLIHVTQFVNRRIRIGWLSALKKEKIEKKENIKQFKDILERIENEGGSRGLLDPSKLCANFNQEESNEIVDMYKEWWKLRNDRNDGELDKAI